MADADDLALLKDRLNALDNGLAASLGEAERALGSLRLGVPIQMKIGDGSTLIFCKHNKSWRLVLERENGDRTMLCDAPRESRALALQSLPALLASAGDQMREKISQREGILSQTVEFIRAIKSSMEGEADEK